jgi:hypothetical protein
VRLGDRERELLFEALKQHSAAGRLDLEELERRVERLAEAQTTDQAAEVLADLPPLVPAGVRAGRARWGKGHGEADTAAPEWRPTNERFRDPRTNRVMRVWVDTAGGRHYVVDEGT